MQQQKISVELDKNVKAFEALFDNCSDIKKQYMSLGKNGCIRAWAAYIEVTLDGGGINAGGVGRFVASTTHLEKNQIFNFLEKNRSGLFDMAVYSSIEETAQGMLTGDVILFVEGIDFAIKIPDKGPPPACGTHTQSLQTCTPLPSAKPSKADLG